MEQQLACRDWRGVNRTEEGLLMEEGEVVGDGTAEGSSAAVDGGQAAVSLMSDIDGTRSGSLLEPNAHLHLWKFAAAPRGLTVVPPVAGRRQKESCFLDFVVWTDSSCEKLWVKGEDRQTAEPGFYLSLRWAGC